MEQHFSGTPGQTGSNSRGGQATEQAKQQTQQFAHQARQQAGELANRGGEQVKSQLATQKHQAAQRITPVQMALRETAEQLRKQGQGSIAQYTDGAAGQVERFSGYLRETEVDQIADEARGFARRRPSLFLGGAAVLGFLGTRFLKSSAQRGPSAGEGSGAIPTATSGAAVTYGTGEPATALPPDITERESPTAMPMPTAGQSPSDRHGRGE